MEGITIRELLEAVDGMLLAGEESAVITAVSTDSRKIQPGSLFIPLVGERFDGHTFINKALQDGAAACLTQREDMEMLPGKCYIRVNSTHRALGDLAHWYKGKFHIPFVCITGSVGKTTTKDMVAAVLGERFQVLKTDGNFNNDVGLPLTLLRLDKSHEICVLEMGMNHAGEIAYLSGIAEPDVALITNIGDSHMEHLGSREGIFKAKCEIFSHMREGGTAILNGDDQLLPTLRGSLPFTTLLVGTGEGLDYRADQVESGISHVSCRITTPTGRFTGEIPALGAHMLYPALMAAAVGEKFGMGVEEIRRGLLGFRPTGMRMKAIRLPQDIVVFNDAYNAGPQSMAAAAAVLGEFPGRRVAVIGDMLELGADSGRFHREVGAGFAAHGAHCVIAVGQLAIHMAEGAKAAGVPEVYHFASKKDAMDTLLAQRQPGTAILVKASRLMAFEEFAAALTEDNN